MSEFVLNIDLIKNSKEIPAVIKALAYRMSAETYVTPGAWFSELHDRDLKLIMDIIDETVEYAGVEHETGSRSYKANYELLLLSMMLHIAEGAGAGVIESEEEDSNHKILELFKTYASIESLHRKGLAEAIHDNFTFDIAALDKVVVRPTEAGKDLARKLRGEE